MKYFLIKRRVEIDVIRHLSKAKEVGCALKSSQGVAANFKSMFIFLSRFT